MRYRKSTDLHELVMCMSRSEKRTFSKQTGSKKLLLLFNAVNGNKPFYDKQAHNLKAVLYRQLLGYIKSNEVEKSLHNGIEQAKLLYDKKLYQQSYKALYKVKKLAVICNQVSFQFQALALEKKLRVMHVIENSSSDIKRLQQESGYISNELSSISHYSLQSLLLYSYYSRWGSLAPLPDVDLDKPTYGFYSDMYKLQCLLYVTLINGKDQKKCAAALCEHIEKTPFMKMIERIQYEKAKEFLETAIQVPEGDLKDDPVIICRYLNYANHLYDNRDFNQALDFLISLVNTKLFFRIDLQVKARELHIECHRALGNEDIIHSLEKSLKRFRNNFAQ